MASESMWVSDRDMPAECARLATERDNWQQRAEAAQRASAVDASTVQRMTEEVYRLKDAGEQLIAECNRVSAERDAARAEVVPAVLSLRAERDSALADLREISVERDSALEHRDYLQAANEGLREERDAARAEVLTLIGERNQFRIDAINWEQRTEALIRKADALVAERDAAQNETHELRRQYAKLHTEVEGLRADLLAHPPETHTELAIARQRHVELMEDYDRQTVTITMLQNALQRAENAMKTAQAKHIDPRLKGLLSVLSRTASEAEEMLP